MPESKTNMIIETDNHIHNGKPVKKGATISVSESVAKLLLLKGIAKPEKVTTKK